MTSFKISCRSGKAGGREGERKDSDAELHDDDGCAWVFFRYVKTVVVNVVAVEDEDKRWEPVSFLY